MNELRKKVRELGRAEFLIRYCSRLLLELRRIDLTGIPTNNGTESRSGWTKIQRMYENVHPNLALKLLFARTEVEYGKGPLTVLCETCSPPPLVSREQAHLSRARAAKSKAIRREGVWWRCATFTGSFTFTFTFPSSRSFGARFRARGVGTPRAFAPTAPM